MQSGFVLISSARSGSTWVIDMLNNLDGVTAYGELFIGVERDFIAGATDYPTFIESANHSNLFRPYSVFKYLESLYARAGLVGFKLMYSQLRKYPEILYFLAKHRMKIIHLIRENHLDVVISLGMAELSGVWHIADERDVIETQIYIDPVTLVGKLRKLRRKINIIRKLINSVRLSNIELVYENLAMDISNIKSVFNFLGINQIPPSVESRPIKIRKSSHQVIISNYHEVKIALMKTEFSDLIE